MRIVAARMRWRRNQALRRNRLPAAGTLIVKLEWLARSAPKVPPVQPTAWQPPGTSGRRSADAARYACPASPVGSSHYSGRRVPSSSPSGEERFRLLPVQERSNLVQIDPRRVRERCGGRVWRLKVAVEVDALGNRDARLDASHSA